MILLRLLAFALFLALVIALGVWQFHNVAEHLRNHANAWLVLGVSLAIPLAQGAAIWLVPRRHQTVALAVAGLPALPVTAAAVGVLNAIQARAGDRRAIWHGALIVGALATLNLGLPLLAALGVAEGNARIGLAWMGLKVQFFVAVDYFLVRALVHYFNSGASAFVSLRYLRRRVISLLSVFGVGVGVAVLILINSIMTGFQLDFKEQVRGSLSHLLVRFDGYEFHLNEHDEPVREAEWAEYVRRIENSPAMAPAWRDLLRDAVAAAGPEAAPDLAARLRSGRLNALEREYLRDQGRIVTPRQFYLSRVANPDQADLDFEARRAWYAPLFRQQLQAEFDKAAQALAQHVGPDGKPDVQGVSWRVSARTFLTPRTANRELPLAELVGVDPLRETEISDLGNYMAAAEVQVFKEQFVLRPLLNLLGATLGWETTESLEAMRAQPRFTFTEDGRNVGLLPNDMRQYLGQRGIVTGTGNVRWPVFDQVKFRDMTPAARLYATLRDAHRAAHRSTDLDELRPILQRVDRDVRALIAPHLAGPGVERHEQVAHTGSRIIYNRYLTGLDAVAQAIRFQHATNYEPIKDMLDESLPDPIQGPERDELNKLWRALDDATRKAMAAATEGAPTEVDREQSLVTLIEDYRAALAAFTETGTEVRWPSAELTRQLLALLPKAADVLPMTRAQRMGQAIPLAWALAQFDSGAELARRRMEAYRVALPLRTTMQPEDTLESYVARAREPGRRPGDGVNAQAEEPGLIIGDALAESALLGGVSIGDVIEITVPRVYFRDSQPVVSASQVKFRITGFFRSGLYEDNLGRIYCDFDELASLLADSEVRYHIGAKLANYQAYEGGDRPLQLKAGIRRLLHENEVRFSSQGVSLWEDEKRALLEAVEREKGILGLIVGFIIVLAGVLILILVYQLVNEKVKDIGILKALGHSPWGVRSVFMFNALFIGLFGAVIGCALGVTLSHYLNEIENFIEGIAGVRLFPPDVYFLTYIPSVKGNALLNLALDIGAPVVLFSFGCGILPAQLAARKDPVEALHYE